jgi:hypothetical protein
MFQQTVVVLVAAVLLRLDSLVVLEEVAADLIMEEAYQFLLKDVMVELVVDHPVPLAHNPQEVEVEVPEDLAEMLHPAAARVDWDYSLQSRALMLVMPVVVEAVRHFLVEVVQHIRNLVERPALLVPTD